MSARRRDVDPRPAILFVVNDLGGGGAERHVVSLLNHLDTSRYRLHLAYLRRNDQLGPLLRAERLDAVIDCGVSSRVDAAAMRRLREALHRHRIDILVCTNVYSTLYGFAARLFSRRRTKLVSVLHTTILPNAKARAVMQLYKLVARHCDLLVYVCELQRAYWRRRRLGARRDAVEHNGIDVARFAQHVPVDAQLALRARLGFAPTDYVIGICAHLRPEKAHGDLLHALARLRAAGVPAKALLIGDGAERVRIERTADALGVSGHVHVTGLQSDVRPYVAVCDVMALVSHAVETFSLSALEAMAAGKPMVMTDIGGAGEQVVHGESGLLYPAGDVAALTAHLTVLTDRELRAAYGAAAADRVRRCFTLPRMVGGFERRFDELLQGAPAPLVAAPAPRGINPEA